MKVGASQCRCSVPSPMMGDAPSGVVARRTSPSGVASFGRVTHAPADPRALYRAMRRSLLHQSRAAPGSPKVGSRMVRGGGGGGLRRAVLGQGCRHARFCADLRQGGDVPVVQARRWSRREENCGVPQLQFSDKVDMPVVVNDRCSEVPQVQFLRLWTSL